MRLGLVVKEFRNNNIDYNKKQIVNTVFENRNNKIDFLCFGEAFLQGFDAFKWNFNYDEEFAITRNSRIINDLKTVAKSNKIGLLLGMQKKMDCLF